MLLSVCSNSGHSLAVVLLQLLLPLRVTLRILPTVDPYGAVRLVSGSLDASIRLWPLFRGEGGAATLRGHGGEVKCLAQLYDGPPGVFFVGCLCRWMR